MLTLPSKEELKSMMYRDLQKVCKDWGVRANLKSDEMIDLLLAVQSRNSPTVAPPPTLQPPAQPRSVSTRRSTSRAMPTRLSSAVKHDVPEENTQQQDKSTATNVANPIIDSQAAIPLAPPTRTKKAKELQRRLGVGRPVAVGGSGPRAVTRSTTVSQERRLRSTRSMRNLETTQEEAESPGIPLTQETKRPTRFQPSSSLAEEDALRPMSPDKSRQAEIPQLPPGFQRLLSEIIKPLQDQIETLRAEVKRLQSLETEMQALGALVKQTREAQVNDEARSWEKVLGTQSRPPYTAEPTTPPAMPHLHVPSKSRTLMPSPHITTPPVIAPVLLGKRPRGSSSTRQSPIIQNEGQLESSQGTPGPVKKRLKLSGETAMNKGKEIVRDDRVLPNKDTTSSTLPRATSFIVYNDPEEVESPPPNSPLPDYYTSRSGSPRQGHVASSANAAENQHPFNFSLLPEPSTPGPTLFFPYPEPPQSPTPTGPSLAGSLSNNNDRSDVFKSFGLPPPDRARRLPSGPPSDTVDPATISQPEKQRHSSKDETRPSFSSGSRELGASSERDSGGIKRTMYGTELEGDTRFGDFGVEGVAMGFWTGSRF